METPVKAINDKVIAQLITETKTPGGIIIPETAKSPQFIGTVLSVGDKVLNIKEGDIIVCHKNGGMDIFLNQKVYKVLKNDEIYGIMKGETN